MQGVVKNGEGRHTPSRASALSLLTPVSDKAGEGDLYLRGHSRLHWTSLDSGSFSALLSGSRKACLESTEGNFLGRRF